LTDKVLGLLARFKSKGKEGVMLYTHQDRLPYSDQGLTALQKTLKLHADLVSPVISVNPLTGAMEIKNISQAEMEEEE